MRAKCDNGGERILLADNKGGGAVMLRAIRVKYVGVCISAGLPFISQYSWPCVYTTVCYAKLGVRRDLRNVTDAQA
jgi:hypothetical protein